VPFPSLGTRSTYLILLGVAALDAAGYSMIAPVVPAISDQTGAGPGVIGALVAMFAVGQLIGFPLAGRGIQRRHASVVLWAALALMALGDLGFIVGESLGVYFPARVLMGIGAGGLWMGVTFAVLEHFPGQELPRLSGVLAAYSVGGIAGPAMGAAGGIQGPFVVHLAASALAAVAIAALGAPRERAEFGSDRAALRTAGFWLASAGILMIALGYGAIDGPLPLHFDERLDQSEIAGLYVIGALVLGASAAAAGRGPPRPMLAAAAVVITGGIGLAGLTETVPWWIAGIALTSVGLGIGETGALGILLETVGAARLVLAMVVWSQVWAVGYLAGPAVAGAVAESAGFGAIGLVPLGAALLVLVALAVLPRPSPARSEASRA
jgi:MFS family permease